MKFYAKRTTHLVNLLRLENILHNLEVRDVLILMLRIHLDPLHRHVTFKSK